MNYLELTNTILDRVNEVALTEATFPSTTLVGPQKVAKGYVLDAINDIHLAEQKWPFMYSEGVQALTIGTYDYTQPIDTAHIDFDSFFITAATGITAAKLTETDYAMWRRKYKQALLNATDAQRAKPSLVYERPGTGYGFDKSPDAAYSVVFDYWKIPTRMALFGDTPDVPVQFHYIIEDGGTERMYDFRNDPDMAMKYRDKFNKGLKTMSHALIKTAKAAGVR